MHWNIVVGDLASAACMLTWLTGWICIDQGWLHASSTSLTASNSVGESPKGSQRFGRIWTWARFLAPLPLVIGDVATVFYFNYWTVDEHPWILEMWQNVTVELVLMISGLAILLGYHPQHASSARIVGVSDGFAMSVIALSFGLQSATVKSIYLWYNRMIQFFMLGTSAIITFFSSPGYASMACRFIRGTSMATVAVSTLCLAVLRANGHVDRTSHFPWSAELSRWLLLLSVVLGSLVYLILDRIIAVTRQRPVAVMWKSVQRAQSCFGVQSISGSEPNSAFGRRKWSKPTRMTTVFIALVVLCGMIFCFSRGDAGFHLAASDAIPSAIVSMLRSQDYSIAPQRTTKDLNSARHGDRVQLCFVFGSILDIGGVEKWFYSLMDSVFLQPPYTVYALQTEFVWTDLTIQRMSELGVIFNPGHEHLSQHCDAIIQTGCPPQGMLPFRRKPVRILVSHGSDEYTLRYTSFAYMHDALVAVSGIALQGFPRQERDRVKRIGLGTPTSSFTPTTSVEAMKRHLQIPVGKKILLLAGRVAPEKDPNFFVEVVRALPEDWIGLSVGQLFMDVAALDPYGLTGHRVFWAGGTTEMHNIYQLADAMIHASRSEGGPYVLVEAWGAGVPVFMRRVGYVHEFPEAVFLIAENEKPESVAIRIHQQISGGRSAVAQRTVAKGLQIYQQHFSATVVAESWTNVITAAFQKRLSNAELSVAPLNTYSAVDSGCQIVAVGRTKRAHCISGMSRHQKAADLSFTMDLSRWLQLWSASHNSASPSGIEVDYSVESVFNGGNDHGSVVTIGTASILCGSFAVGSVPLEQDRRFIEATAEIPLTLPSYNLNCMESLLQFSISVDCIIVLRDVRLVQRKISSDI